RPFDGVQRCGVLPVDADDDLAGADGGGGERRSVEDEVGQRPQEQRVLAADRLPLGPVDDDDGCPPAGGHGPELAAGGESGPSPAEEPGPFPGGDEVLPDPAGVGRDRIGAAVPGQRLRCAGGGRPAEEPAAPRRPRRAGERAGFGGDGHPGLLGAAAPDGRAPGAAVGTADGTAERVPWTVPAAWSTVRSRVRSIERPEVSVTVAATRPPSRVRMPPCQAVGSDAGPRATALDCSATPPEASGRPRSRSENEENGPPRRVPDSSTTTDPPPPSSPPSTAADCVTVPSRVAANGLRPPPAAPAAPPEVGAPAAGSAGGAPAAETVAVSAAGVPAALAQPGWRGPRAAQAATAAVTRTAPATAAHPSAGARWCQASATRQATAARTAATETTTSPSIHVWRASLPVPSPCTRATGQQA